MQISSPVHARRARIEIIPLIDIMFFLLAAFMMVSLRMTKVQNRPVNLPIAIAAQSDFGADLLHVAVDNTGGIWIEKQPVQPAALYTILTNRLRINPQLPVFIGGDASTPHREMVKVLNLARQAGVQQVGCTVVARQP